MSLSWICISPMILSPLLGHNVNRDSSKLKVQMLAEDANVGKGETGTDIVKVVLHIVLLQQLFLQKGDISNVKSN